MKKKKETERKQTVFKQYLFLIVFLNYDPKYKERILKFKNNNNNYIRNLKIYFYKVIESIW